MIAEHGRLRNLIQMWICDSLSGCAGRNAGARTCAARLGRAVVARRLVQGMTLGLNVYNSPVDEPVNPINPLGT